MNILNKKIKIITLMIAVFCISLTLLVTLGQGNESYLEKAIGASGPCLGTFDDCGWEASGSCFDSEPLCGGTCGKSCGPGDENEFCADLILSCNLDFENCALVQKNRCTHAETGCFCTPTGGAGWYCTRSDC